MNDDDRDTAISRLKDAVGRGQLDLTEFERRSDEVVRATSPDDLSAAVANLPLDPAARDAAERREQRRGAGRARPDGVHPCATASLRAWTGSCSPQAPWACCRCSTCERSSLMAISVVG